MLKENRMIQGQLEKLEWGLPVCMGWLDLWFKSGLARL
jgi:hypothetical protein